MTATGNTHPQGTDTAGAVRAWLLTYFLERGALPGAGDEERIQADLFDSGALDSFGFLDLITAMEDAFGIAFEQEHLKDRRLTTIAGLAEIIEAIRAASAGGAGRA